MRKPPAVAVAVTWAARDSTADLARTPPTMRWPHRRSSASITSVWRSAFSASASPASTALTGCSGPRSTVFPVCSATRPGPPRRPRRRCRHPAPPGTKEARPAQFRGALPPSPVEGDAVAVQLADATQRNFLCPGTTPCRGGEQQAFGRGHLCHRAVLASGETVLGARTCASVPARTSMLTMDPVKAKTNAGTPGLWTIRWAPLNRSTRLPPMTFSLAFSSRPCAAGSSTRLTGFARPSGCASPNRRSPGQRRSGRPSA